MNRSRSTGAKKRADEAFSKIVRSRGRCENCGEGRYERLQCAHIVSRRYSNTRCDEANAMCMCARCHLHFTEWPLEFAEFVTAKIGDDAYAALVKKALSVSSKVDWFEVAASLKQRLKEVA